MLNTKGAQKVIILKVPFGASNVTLQKFMLKENRKKNSFIDVSK